MSPTRRRAHAIRRLVAGSLVVASAVALPATAAGAGDTTPPTVSAPVTIVRLWGNANDRTIPFKATWAGTDSSGIATYRLQLRTDAGAWSTVALVRPAAGHARLRLAPGHDYRLRVRATDGAGNRSPYATADAFHVRRFSEVAAGTSTTGPWTRRTNDGYIGGHALVSGTDAASFSFTFAGTEIAWITTSGGKQGSTSVFLDDTFKTMANLTRTGRNQYGRMAYRFAWPVSGEHVLRLVPLIDDESGDRVTDVDGLVVVGPARGGGPTAGG